MIEDDGRDLELMLEALVRESKSKGKDDGGELKAKLQPLLKQSKRIDRRIRPSAPMPQGRRLTDQDGLVLCTVHNLELMIWKVLPDKRVHRIQSLTSLIMSELER